MDQLTQNAISSAVDAYVTAQVLASQQTSETDFLYGRKGLEFLGLHRLPESQTEMVGYWTQPGNVGNDPGKIGSQGPRASYAWMPGNQAILKAIGVLKDWANVYLYTKLPQPTILPRRIVDQRTFQITDLSGWQALEFQWQISKGGLTFNGAWQANFGNKIWRYFDYTNTKWLEFPGVPLPDFSNPIVIAAEFSLDALSTTHVSLAINGTVYPIGIKQDATKRSNAEKLTAAVQIDTKPNGSCSLNILQTDLRMV